ncbi:response regulator transcription factor [Streptomyces gobiensis]|uniref:response regulator transcription factor n=1 Tax=Streptomyces gobiensis TaxID=2875706 RepID=UPI001E395771|nr:response regulator [Streptomyces gobiensis]UGY94629.1 response regulator [Streptomyces gobiensis]
MIRALVVDDDFMVARLHSKLVERVPGFTVVGEARSGGEALEAVSELRPDLVLLDIYLPDMNGLDVLRQLRAGGAPQTEVDVLVVTAARDAETVRGALRGGAVHYIIKPFDAPMLRERLQHYARRHQELAAIAKPGQDDVDRVFGAAPTGSPVPAKPAVPVAPAMAVAARLPKGVTEQTAGLVRRTLAESPAGLSASECAVRSGLSRVSARRYLEFFVSSGRAQVTLRYGTTGRPERRYHWLAGPG